MPDLKPVQPTPNSRSTHVSSDRSTGIGPKLKCIRVNLDKLVVALPIDRVEKIIKQTTVLGSGLSHMGVMHYAGELVTVVDLHYQLFQTWQPTPTESLDGYLILVKTKNKDRFAFPIQGAPNLLEFSLSELRVLPASYRQADTLGIASHVVRLPQPTGEDSTIFILDVDYLAAQFKGKDSLTPA